MISPVACAGLGPSVILVYLGVGVLEEGGWFVRCCFVVARSLCVFASFAAVRLYDVCHSVLYMLYSVYVSVSGLTHIHNL